MSVFSWGIGAMPVFKNKWALVISSVLILALAASWSAFACYDNSQFELGRMGRARELRYVDVIKIDVQIREAVKFPENIQISAQDIERMARDIFEPGFNKKFGGEGVIF